MTHSINVPLARKTLEYLEDHPDDHVQSTWAYTLDPVASTAAVNAAEDKISQVEQMALGACGTVGCFAGWAAAIDGHTVGTVGDLAGVVLDLSAVEVKVESFRNPFTDVEVPTIEMVYGPEAPVVYAEDYAREALGLTANQASVLFSGANSRRTLRRMLSEWTDGEIEAVRPR